MTLSLRVTQICQQSNHATYFLGVKDKNDSSLFSLEAGGRGKTRRALGVRRSWLFLIFYSRVFFDFFSTARKIKASGIFEFAATEIVLTVLVVTYK